MIVGGQCLRRSDRVAASCFGMARDFGFGWASSVKGMSHFADGSGSGLVKYRAVG